MSAESEKDAQARWIIKRDEPACTCKPQNPKHKEGWRCITHAQINAWEKATDAWHNTAHARMQACWMWLHFSQDPEARRLSGRPVTLEESDKLNAYMALADHFGHDDATGTEWWQREM